MNYTEDLPARGAIAACYLNGDSSPYAGALKRIFGSCGGQLFYRPPRPGRLSLYVCEVHQHEGEDDD